jgi:hypothetical protein
MLNWIIATFPALPVTSAANHVIILVNPSSPE